MMAILEIEDWEKQLLLTILDKEWTTFDRLREGAIAGSSSETQLLQHQQAVAEVMTKLRHG
jgi:hypothetical protein